MILTIKDAKTDGPKRNVNVIGELNEIPFKLDDPNMIRVNLFLKNSILILIIASVRSVAFSITSCRQSFTNTTPSPEGLGSSIIHQFDTLATTTTAATAKKSRSRCHSLYLYFSSLSKFDSMMRLPDHDVLEL